MEGFKPFAKKIALKESESRVENIPLELATVAVSIDVAADVSTVTEQNADRTDTLTTRELPALPMPEQTAKEALPRVAGVVRTLDGTLNIKGQPESQGMLLVDSAQMVDPVSGSFASAIPLAAVETLSIHDTPYNSQYGGFSGGLVTIQTKAPPDKWQYSLMDFVPGLRGKNGQIVGVSSETPRLFVGGPILKRKLNISEAFDYVLRKRPVRGLAWPVNETWSLGFTSFTNIQAILSPRHVLTGNVMGFSARTQFADINSLVPQSASSNSGSQGAYASMSDSYQLGSGTLVTGFRYSRVDTNAYGQGAKDLLMTPQGLGGNAFNTWTRRANQFEALPTFQLSRRNWLGTHDLRFGLDVVHASYTGTSQSRPIQVLREDGSLAERIDFRGAGLLRGAETEISEFAQDHWALNDHLAIDSGIRLSTQSNGRPAALAPRAGFSIRWAGSTRRCSAPAPGSSMTGSLC